jgi:protein phosphatase 1 regulatory subunit 3A/B/C/D/E
MSSIAFVSPLTLHNNNNNSTNNESNDSKSTINSIKLKVNGRLDSDECLSCDAVLNKCNNGLNIQNNDSVIDENNGSVIDENNDFVIESQNKKSLKIDMKSSGNSNGNDFEDDLSEPSTLSSSPVTSPTDEMDRHIDEALLEQKFSKLGFDNLKRYDSPIIQINGHDSCDDEEEDSIRVPLIRSTSLKTGKTPPGTPHRKKFVRFADALGLDLESVRHIITDDLPVVPQSAFGALKLDDKSDQPFGNSNQIPWFLQKQNKSISQSRPNLMLEFIQPSSLLNFMDRVRNNKVCLENCIVSNSAGNLSITCVIRVLNISFEKSVTLRYTSNEWLTFNEALASYIPNSCDGFSDKFTVNFSVSAGGYYLTPGQRLLFAIKYIANTEEYWDNNMGLNYSLIYRV